MRHGGRTTLLAVALALLAPAALAVPAQGTARAAAACADADLVPSASDAARVRRATLCLVNGERTQRGLSRLTARRELETAATRYGRQMVAQRFFDHVSPSGSTLVQRVRQTGYLRNASGWSLGENLAWGSGDLATPRAIVAAWMASPGHRANILRPRFRDAGIGLAPGAPLALGGGTSAGTYVNVFGRR